MKNKKDLMFWGIVLLVLVGLIGWAVYASSAPGKYDALAQCLKDKGTIFYGAFWCPHCQSQKRMFGNSVKLLNYVECSTADGRGQLPVCSEKGIKSYPTWVFPDKSELTGEVSLDRLAEKSGCTLTN